MQRKDSASFSKLAASPVAYFCMEFCLPENLPIYAGGLGVLAGDYVMEAEQQSFPMIGVGLFYPEKCFMGESGGYCVPNDPVKLGLHPVCNILGERIYIDIPVEDHLLKLQAWLYQNGTVPVYLLDGNLPENASDDKEALRLLYTASPEGRLKQELVLGIGGIRLLDAVGIQPSVFHMNEGHSAFLIFELARHFIKNENLSFENAFARARKKIAFTNHTLVVGGHDVFSNKLVAKLLKKFSKDSGIKTQDMMSKGADKQNKRIFSATFLALNSAAKINAVSVLHTQEARKLWPSYETIAVTNGVNIKRWDKVGTLDLKLAHSKNKAELLKLIRSEAGVRWHEKDLLISWARRIVSYKRPTALFEDMARLKKILNDRHRPVKLIFSGNPHYHDTEGIWLLNYLRKLARRELRGKMIFIEKYNTDISSKMIAGSDVWLNTPIVGLEACGTSGMKAALNGVIPCSTDDGWLPEVDLDKIGFKLDDQYITLSLLDTIADKIIPLFFSREKELKLGWEEKMNYSREAIIQNFGSDRMLKDYIEKIYKPIIENL